MARKGEQSETRTISMYPSDWNKVERFADAEGYSVSLAIRKIIDDWELWRDQRTVNPDRYEVQS